MQPFTRLSALVCPLPLPNVDTDQLIPARFMKRTRAQGYGEQLMHDLRRNPDGTLRTDFPPNDPARSGAQILVARRNFGGGSSREAAAYALVDGGFRCVLAPSFGDIFSSNAVNNGLLPARIGEAEAEHLLDLLAAGLRELTVDLETCTVTAGNEVLPFTVAPTWRTKLLNGWDDIDLTLSHRAAIEAFATARAAAHPWTLPTRPA
ncbi:3-isopropylmalate dehydratase small subunit [Roseomonas sp. BN140053]|uniref:3-isopropylmalate dehydratase small subunit n=1 Tax=Roseomonas sp. BN140053 TaxID=3391898 RepID=UPI0039E9F56C